MSRLKNVQQDNTHVNEETIAIILGNNEARVNVLAVRLFLIIFMILVMDLVLCYFGVYKVGRYINSSSYLMPLACSALPIAAYIGRQQTSVSLKWINISCVISHAAWCDCVWGYNATLVMAVPIVFGSMYFYKKTTITSFVLTTIAFAFSTYIGATGDGLYDNNHSPVPDGTILEIHGTLKQSLLDAGLRNDEYIFRTMCYGYLPKMTIALLLMALAMIITRLGYEIIIKQAAITEEKTRNEAELRFAGQLQASALPSADTFNGKYNYEIAAGMKPARECGGDFYDFGMLDEEHLVLVMADVSDKGVPAAMFMMSAKGKIRGNLNSGKSLAGVVADVNNLLCINNEKNMFVTVWLGILNIKTGRLVYVNAGHERTIIQRAGGRFEEINDEHGMMLGVFEDLEFKENEMQLEPGDVLIQYTDGVTDERNENGEIYGMGRLLDNLNSAYENRQASAEQINDRIIEDLNKFIGHAEPVDDVATLVLKFS